MLWPVLLPFALVGAFVLLLFTVALIEKRLICPYVAFPPDLTVELPPYVQEMGVDLLASQFNYDATLSHAKYPLIKIIGTVWMSPAKEILVVTGSGKVAGMAAKQTWLYTPLADGTYLVTTDQNDEGDHSRLLRVRRLINLRFTDLLKLHSKRIHSQIHDVRSFAEANGVDALTAFHYRKSMALVHLGRARWADTDQRFWRYTVSGATCVCLNFFWQFAAALPQFWRVNLGPIAAPFSSNHEQTILDAFEKLNASKAKRELMQ